VKIIRKSCFVETDFTRESIQRLLHTGINDHRRTGNEGSEVEGVEIYLYSFFNLGARCGMWSTPPPRSVPGPSSPKRFAIPTTPSQAHEY
jgi:hypothetical protein